MAAQTLYQISASTGKTKVWSIWVEDNGTSADIIIQSGQLGGKLITNRETISEGKNIGKANETDYFQQAHSELQSKVDQKIRKGYVYDLKEVKSSATLGSGIRAPMLAQKYHPTGAQKGSKTLKQMKIEGQRIIVQPKLDGNRCVIHVKDGEAVMSTRKGDKMLVQLNHILVDLINNFSFNQNEYKELELDGELYCDPSIMSFNTLNGLLKKQTPDLIQFGLQQQIKLHLYDVMLDVGYEKRKEIIKPFASNNVEIVESVEIIATDENIQKQLDIWLGMGYEGLMIRVLGKGYENKRSWQLVKCKIFEDREFKLIGFEEDVRGGFAGNFILELPKSLLIELGKPLVDKEGKPIVSFKAGASGQTEADRRYMWKYPEEFIGKMATVEYFGWDYRPRFAKFKGIREGGN
jgi:DNA ligase 1